MRRGIIAVSPLEIAHLLDLPDGLRVVAVHTEFDPVQIKIAVEGPMLEPVADGAYAPRLNGSLTRRQRVDSEGKVWTRWDWSPEEWT